MQILLYAFAFFLVSLGVAALAAIPFLISKARHYDETASALNVSTQIQVQRYNSWIGTQQKQKTPAKPKLPNLYPIRDNDGDGKNDNDPKPKR